MSFFQNVFDDYIGNWSLSSSTGKEAALSFKVPGNKNRGQAILCWNAGPFDLSDGGILTINFAFDPSFKNFVTINIDVTGEDDTATTALEIVTILNLDANFSSWYVAYLENNQSNRILIEQKKSTNFFKTYITNSGAELVMKFNKKAGVVDIPSYFEKDSISNRFELNSNGVLTKLGSAISSNTLANPSIVNTSEHGLVDGDVVYITGSNSTPSINGSQIVTVIDAYSFSIPVNVTVSGSTGEWFTPAEKQIITDADLNYEDMLADWQHLKGRTNTFEFSKNTIDETGRILTRLVYPTGAKVGSVARKTFYSYTDALTTPVTELEIPCILTINDLMYP